MPADDPRDVQRRLARLERDVHRLRRSWARWEPILVEWQRVDLRGLLGVVELIAHTVVVVVLIAAYVAVVLTGHDGTAVLGLAAGYLLGAGAQKIAGGRPTSQ